MAIKSVTQHLYLPKLPVNSLPTLVRYHYCRIHLMMLPTKNVHGFQHLLNAKIYIKIICSAIVLQTANSAVQIVQVLVDILRAICRVGYDFLNNVGTVKDVFVNLGAYGFLNTNTIVVILVRVVAKGLKLSAPFPSYRGSKIIGRVAVDIIISYLLLYVKKNSPRQFRLVFGFCTGE